MSFRGDCDRKNKAWDSCFACTSEPPPFLVLRWPLVIVILDDKLWDVKICQFCVLYYDKSFILGGLGCQLFTTRKQGFLSKDL